ncbi:fibrinogen-like protein 1-like protein isoform X1 [Prinia subflava]|uniref:fibrinogen-like protein 1-like protein isoform X1 n=1 Tax=Prinia subflava TaxID=208062 RepID=UPI002FE07F9B
MACQKQSLERKGEIFQRWEEPTLTETYHIEAQHFKTFLLQDFCTRSHKYCHFQFQPVLQLLLQEERKMPLRSSAGFLLLLLSQCTVSLGTTEAVVLANAHLLPQRDYERLGNANEKDYPRDCFEILQRSKGNSRDGLYIIQPKEESIVVFCNMQDGGWTVIQHITANSTVDFDRTWQDYKYGFGSVHENHWLGNEYMHQLTGSSVQYVLGVKLVNLDAEVKWGQYEPFLIEGEESQYRLRVGLYKGNATDALTLDTEAYLHDNQKFTTKDRDNDNYFMNCAKLELNGIPGGGWWYDACAGANLNRRNVIYWQKDCNKQRPCKFAWMMVKPIEHHQSYPTKACPCQKVEL